MSSMKNQNQNLKERDNELDIIFQDEPIQEQRRKKPILEKCVRRHHAPE